LRRHHAPNAANVLSNLVRIRTLELGKLGCVFDLEEYLFSRGRDELDSSFSVTPLTHPPLIKGNAYSYIDCFIFLRLFDIWGLGYRILIHCVTRIGCQWRRWKDDKVLKVNSFFHPSFRAATQKGYKYTSSSCSRDDERREKRTWSIHRIESKGC